MKIKFLVRIELDEEETRTLSLQDCKDIESDILSVIDEAISTHLMDPSNSDFNAADIADNEPLNDRFSNEEFDINIIENESAVCVVSNSETLIEELNGMKNKQERQEKVFDKFKSTSTIDPFLLSSIFSDIKKD